MRTLELELKSSKGKMGGVEINTDEFLKHVITTTPINVIMSIIYETLLHNATVHKDAYGHTKDLHWFLGNMKEPK